jgi:TRAP-type mannitol/chloroaromatic compound transport system substrate-binding protein
MAAGRLRIDLLPAGAVVGAFDIQDAVQDGALDGGHHVPAYWYGKNKAASLFGPGPSLGLTALNSWRGSSSVEGRTSTTNWSGTSSA